jgi:transposase
MQFNWPDNFEALYKQRGQQKYGIRLLAMWKLQAGMTETELCTLIGKTHRSILKWRRSYEEKGLEGLLSMASGRGRKSKLSLNEQLVDDIKTLQAQREGGRIRCQDIVTFVYEQYGCPYTRSGMYPLLHKLGFSWITSRSKHPKHDPEAITAFKKTSKHVYEA